MRKTICVIDGQGGGIGGTLIKYLKERFGEEHELIALGTNAIATAQMLRAGANRGASGENAVCRTVYSEADWVVCSISVTWANAMLGEVTPKIAEAIMSCPAKKILLPINRENAEVIGVAKEPMPHMVKMIVERIQEEINNV